MFIFHGAALAFAGGAAASVYRAAGVFLGYDPAPAGDSPPPARRLSGHCPSVAPPRRRLVDSCVAAGARVDRNLLRLVAARRPVRARRQQRGDERKRMGGTSYPRNAGSRRPVSRRHPRQDVARLPAQRQGLYRPALPAPRPPAAPAPPGPRWQRTSLHFDRGAARASAGLARNEPRPLGPGFVASGAGAVQEP
ncbi:MAG: hypothetical protein AVDCRST_MAG19-148 [uncultured Thermomicrobiales bacterium]|uniref:Uncharacterized protein n=1 Tax=uncultured Thermomicrobiales bacterium TaxID=1645740 RepID=A0A6J4U9I8_9BACT|nr:MAG: hypothetical protein AVDCRST_MAG19-148 [uncultured Thermomicrobiales bacterium]